MKRILLISFYFSFLILSSSQAQDKWEKWGPTSKSGAGVILRAGYTLGGTSPIPLPKEIRSINAFSPKGGATVGFDAYKMFSRRWGLAVGTRFFYEGFHTSADVKNYWTSLVREGNEMSGYFTGRDVTNTSMWGVTLPLLVTFRAGARWNISVGPYFSAYFKRSFDGEVYDNKDGVGYIRVDSPTGEKVNIDRSNPATYDFKDDMRKWNSGLEFTFDWKATKHLNVFGSLDWGLSSIFERDFEAIAFKMYPIYATVGVGYRY
ncbi:MAG: PorT family protein [Bacteroidaceae bacterium]|nr:PorT family protein [Bacteroidaceae bacterium]